MIIRLGQRGEASGGESWRHFDARVGARRGRLLGEDGLRAGRNMIDCRFRRAASTAIWPELQGGAARRPWRACTSARPPPPLIFTAARDRDGDICMRWPPRRADLCAAVL